MNLSILQGEERLFLHRLEDLSRGSHHRPRFSAFLTERQILIAEAYTQQAGYENFLLYGGYSGALRNVLGLFPPHVAPDAAHFPVIPITLAYRDKAELSHRDILGACLSLLITRDSIGDIVVNSGSAVVFCLESTAPVLLGELKKIGKEGVRCEAGAPESLEREDRFVDLRGTVHSPRLDSLVSLLTGISREKSAALIRGERVQLNHTPATSISRPFSPGDVISVRGYGKYVVDDIGNPTKKGRLPVTCRKYS